MKTTDLSTRLRRLARLKLREVLRAKKPWMYSDQVERRRAFQSCRVEAELLAAHDLGLTDLDLEVIRGW